MEINGLLKYRKKNCYKIVHWKFNLGEELSINLSVSRILSQGQKDHRKSRERFKKTDHIICHALSPIARLPQKLGSVTKL